MKQTNQTFSHRLKAKRESKGYSKQELARLIGVSLDCYNRYESAIAEIPRMSAETLCKICRVLDVRADYLLGVSSHTSS